MEKVFQLTEFLRKGNKKITIGMMVFPPIKIFRTSHWGKMILTFSMIL